MMNGSNIGNSSSNNKSKDEQVVNGHDENENNPFAEYMWMENEEDFNRQVEEELQEQEFLDRCFQEMLDEEDQDWFIPFARFAAGSGAVAAAVKWSHSQRHSQFGGHSGECCTPCRQGNLAQGSKSNLNPDAKEFVPGVKY
ncbi:unnamed protein product [Ranitomeya imitator]|uniref:Polyadenylate-binding protein-interacting protein 2B n=1 Tax=Ranitomeya imitator TaxID=111125 RepID=A0ABN9LQC0_9NEOB|nr:unnamed protein product [Ranitomeya imitator]